MRHFIVHMRRAGHVVARPLNCGVMRQSQPMSSGDFLRRLDKLLLIRQCVWIAAFCFFVVAFMTFPKGVGGLPRRGSDLWGYLVVSGEFKWVFLSAAAIALVLFLAACAIEGSLFAKYRYSPRDREPNDGQ